MNRLNVLVFAAGVVTGILSTVLYMRNQYEFVETKDVRGEAKMVEVKEKVVEVEEEEPCDEIEYGEEPCEIAVTSPPDVRMISIPLAEGESTRLRHDDPNFRWHYDLKGDRSALANVHPSELEAPHDGPDAEVISFEEFNEHRPDFDKLTISYYDGDDILADETDQPMIEDRYVIGDEALNRFGGFSGDKDVVYVRYYPLTIDYEVVKIHGKYSELVLGQYRDEDEEVS